MYFPNTRFAEVVQKRQNYCLCIFLFLFTEIIFRVYSNCIKDICSEVDDGFTIIQRKVLNSMCILTIYTASTLHKIFMLHADPYIFGYLFSNFVQSKHDSTCFRIINKHYLQFITEKINKIHMKTFIHILHQRLSMKYPQVESFFLCFKKKYLCAYGTG